MSITETIHFTSPINEDDGKFHNFIGHARSTLEFNYHGDDTPGTMLWRYTFIDGLNCGKTGEETIFLYFNNKRLVQFTGVFELPDQAIELLEDNGFDCRLVR